MAQLKNTVVTGSLRVTDTLFANNIKLLSATASTAIVTDANNMLTSRAITDITTAATNPTANTNLITANTLMNYKGTSNINTLGTITTGTWQGTKINASYLSSSNVNRLVWTGSDGTFTAGNHYASATQISINGTTAPASTYALRVNGNVEIAYGSSRYKYIDFYHGTNKVGQLAYDFNTASGNTKSWFNFIEYSQNSGASYAPNGKYENYILPKCDDDLASSVAYDIYTAKNYPNPIISRKLADLSSASINDITTPGIYSVTGASDINNSTLPSNGSGPYYGMLMVFGGTGAPNGTVGNVAVQIYYGNTSQSEQQQYLYIRSKYAGNWRKWHQVALTKLSI